MREGTLFELPAVEERAAAPPVRPEEVRVVRPVRNQIQFLTQDLDSTLPEDH